MEWATGLAPSSRTYIAARYGDPPLVRTIERASKQRDPDKISVYYRHGFVRFDYRAKDLRKEAADKLVITEQEYFDFFNSPTSLCSHTCLYLLREHSCLFVGLSMQDDNLRRLLHYSVTERARGYQEEGRDDGWHSNVVRHFAIMRIPKKPTVRDAIDAALTALAVTVLWISDYGEIPQKLGSMYSHGGSRWADVF